MASEIGKAGDRAANLVQQLLAFSALREQGYRVLQASSGEEALLVQQRYEARIHLLVIDAVMPGITGPELAARLKLIHPQMKVLIISGYSSDLHEVSSASDPGMAYLQKPFTPGVRSAKVRALING